MTECYSCDGTGSKRNYKYITVCDNCEHDMDEEATKCTNCGNPNWGDHRGYTQKKEYYGSSYACSYCDGSGVVTDTQAAEMRTEALGNAGRGCLTLLILLSIKTMFPILGFWLIFYMLFGINILSCIF